MAIKTKQGEKAQFRWATISKKEFYADVIKVQIVIVIISYTNRHNKWGVQTIKIICQCNNIKS